MNQYLLRLSGFPPPFFFFFLTIILFLLTKPALSVDKQFETCFPQRCGKGPNISYPFWIADQQPDYCGYPGFQLTCKKDEPVFQLQMFDLELIVREIFYENRSLSVLNALWINNTCPKPSLNLTFNDYTSTFSISKANLHLWLFYNCSDFIPQGIDYFNVSCVSNRSFAVLNNNTEKLDSPKFLKTCESSVSVPVRMNYSEKPTPPKRNYSELILNGFLLEWNAPNCNKCIDSGGQCGYNWTQSSFVCFCGDRPHRSLCNGADYKSDQKKKIIIGALAGGGGLLLICISIFLLSHRRKLSSDNPIFFWKKRTSDTCNVEAFLENYGSLAPKRYQFSDIKKMTNSFEDKLGQGGYGGVFKGKLDDDRLVAVKVLNNSKGGNGDEFVNEVASIGRTYHVNVVTLLGFCYEGSKRALVYEFMPNGSLEKFIFSGKSGKRHILDCGKLFEIAIGIARGLEYLHRGCSIRILHFDIKPHNILLDDDFCPKISDFGLAKLCPKQESIVSMMDARGTIGYTAPEVFCRNIGGVSHKSDVYSYGMMVLEMVGGRKNIDAKVENTSEIYFPHWIYKRIELKESLAVLEVKTIAEEEIVRKMILVGLWCIQTDPTNRPSMSKVVEMLEGSLECLQIPPKPYLSSPSRSFDGSSTT